MSFRTNKEERKKKQKETIRIFCSQGAKIKHDRQELIIAFPLHNEGNKSNLKTSLAKET